MGIARRGRYAALLILLVLAGCKTELYASLPEREANEMMGILLAHGVAAEKATAKDGSVILSIEKSQFAQAVSLLSERGYPKQRFENMGEVFKSSGLVASPMQERARFLWALSQELSATVGQIDGVLSARVEVVLPNNDIFARNPAPSSASVFVRYDERSPVATLVPQIKMLVANSVEGLCYDKVSVVMVAAAAPAAVPLAVRGPELEPLALAGAAGGAGVGALLAGVWFNRRRLRAMLRPVSLGQRTPAALPASK